MVCCNSISILSPTTSIINSRRVRYSSTNNNRRKPRQVLVRVRESSAIEDGENFNNDNNSFDDFLRYKKGGKRVNGELQTAVVSYKKKFPWSLLQPFLQVDLVSTVHIADKDYFITLQEELETYDCVLYEMVASKESLENRRSPDALKRLKDSRSSGFNIIGFIQRQLSSILSLEFQLDSLDYDGERWYHADLDFETFKILQDERGENMFTFARDMTLESANTLIQPSPASEDLGPWKSKLLWASRVFPMPLVGFFLIGILCNNVGRQSADYPELEALSRLEFSAAMKIFLARALASDFMQVNLKIEEKSVIIGERNKVAAEALERAIQKGHNRIAVLYGGGHMPDLARRIREEFDLVPSKVKWITAWSIRNRDFNSEPSPILKNLAKVSGWPLNRYQTTALLMFSSFLALDLWLWELFFGSAVNWVSNVASEVSQVVENAWVI